jgi:ergothioneine biosynthesis protein EgtB
MVSVTSSFRNAPPDQLVASLQDARHYTLSLFDLFQASGLDDSARVPYLTIINPPLWELGHLVWFSEWFALRDAPADDLSKMQRPSILADADRWFDSSKVTHPSRWTLDLPDTSTIKKYSYDVLDRIVNQIAKLPDDAAALYRYRLVLAHEDMHGEAFAYTLQTLGMAALPQLTPQQKFPSSQPLIRFQGGLFKLGSPETDIFVFDNEKWSHDIILSDFQIAPSLITNTQYKQFMAAGGYESLQYWNEAGQKWLLTSQHKSPRYWQMIEGLYRCERFGKLADLEEDAPVRHITLHEAQAYCRWAGRRLPSEAEWEFASVSGNPNFRWGNLWEWTSSVFEPYAGFTADAYRDYSAPWFGTHQALRGASFATQPRIRSSRYRNFYIPERDDMFVGFRTCAV